MIAQCLEYAAWASSLTKGQIEEMALRLHEGRYHSLDDLLRSSFGDSASWEPPSINQRQELRLVAQDFSPEVLAVCEWLSERGVPIGCMQFTYYKSESGEEMLTTNELIQTFQTSSPTTQPRVGVVDKAVEILVPRLRDLVAGGGLPGTETWWVHESTCVVTELRNRDGWTAALDIYFLPLERKNAEPHIVVRFKDREPEAVQPLIGLAGQASTILAKLGPMQLGEEGAKWDGLPYWSFAESTLLPAGPWTPDKVADAAERIIRLVLVELPFQVWAWPEG